MNAREYALTKLAEECAEVAQRAMKQAHFGARECQVLGAAAVEPRLLPPNRDRLRTELLDLLGRVQCLVELDELDPITPEHVAEYLAAQRPRWAHYEQYAQECCGEHP
jgi:NTP pyrophosphatase (non-canonical NTP hydrolase)